MLTAFVWILGGVLEDCLKAANGCPECDCDDDDQPKETKGSK